jgi:hypothetical protein
LLFRGAKNLEFFERLTPEVAAIYEEEHSAGTGVLDEPVNKFAGREGLTASRCDLNQGAGLSLSKRQFEILDRTRAFLI